MGLFLLEQLELVEEGDAMRTCLCVCVSVGSLHVCVCVCVCARSFLLL